MKLHHLNLTTANVAKMNDFYRNVMGLAAEPTLSSSRITNQGYSGDTAFATDGHIQVHMSERDLALGFRQKQFVNPLERPSEPTTSLPSRSISTRRGFPTRTMARGP
jgi:glyoxylase I family protein